MGEQARRWFAANLAQLLRSAGGPSYRDLARSTRPDDAGDGGPFAVARRIGLEPKTLAHSTIHDLVAGRRDAPDLWTVLMFVVACACWGARHGSPVTADLSTGALLRLLDQWRRRHGDYLDLLAVPVPEEADERVRVGVVPMQADHFRARSVALDSAPGTTVLTGLGGVGKTQIAVSLATRVWLDRRIRLALWATADSRAAIIDAYARAAHRLLGVTGREQAATALLEWFAVTDRPWLLVLDDLQRPEDMHGLWPTTGRAGQVVVTTRRRDPSLARTDRTVVPVGTFTDIESLSYLTAKLDGQTDGAEELADELGRLPLALAQAAAYQANRGLTCRQYLDRFRARDKALAEVLPEPGELPDDHARTIATTWSLSVELADTLAPADLASPVLHLASFLDPTGAPLIAFTADAARLHLGRALGREVAPDTVHDALSALHRLSLITFDPAQPAKGVQVHALVQRAVRDTLSPEARDHLTEITERALIEATRSGEVDAFAQLYGRHIAAVHSLARHLGLDDGDADECSSLVFAKVLRTLLAGRGPDVNLRGYLLTTLRHTIYDAVRRSRR